MAKVGIPARYFRKLIEERAARSGARARIPRLARRSRGAAAARVVPGDRASIERALGTWLEQEELLQVKRRYPDHTTWEPKGGAFASLQRALGAGGKKFSLARAAELAGSAMPLETGFCHLQLRADIRPLRRQRLVGAMMLLGLGASITALAPVLGALLPWTLLPGALLALAALAYGRGHRRDNERIQVGSSSCSTGSSGARSSRHPGSLGRGQARSGASPPSCGASLVHEGHSPRWSPGLRADGKRHRPGHGNRRLRDRRPGYGTGDLVARAGEH